MLTISCWLTSHLPPYWGSLLKSVIPTIRLRLASCIQQKLNQFDFFNLFSRSAIISTSWDYNYEGKKEGNNVYEGFQERMCNIYVDINKQRLSLALGISLTVWILVLITGCNHIRSQMSCMWHFHFHKTPRPLPESCKAQTVPPSLSLGWVHFGHVSNQLHHTLTVAILIVIPETNRTSNSLRKLNLTQAVGKTDSKSDIFSRQRPLTWNKPVLFPAKTFCFFPPKNWAAITLLFLLKNLDASCFH